ncbi:polymer-forming cytoskeletal protein [Clostridium rectalis]|uniref:polymer-forming cytoskeletal protein n=1 Tax=Clostridium rectalis TaxID=2040295 RepID=UPI000F63E015|nr:polymer-forming cytoskeletal protein [Clostridium rectalis]
MKNKIFIVILAIFLVIIPYSKAEAKMLPKVLGSIIRFNENIYIQLDEVEDSSVICFGADVYVNGKVEGNVLVVGGNAYINGKVNKNVTVIGGNINIAPNGKVEGRTKEIIKDINIPFKGKFNSILGNNKANHNYKIISSFIFLTIFSIIAYNITPGYVSVIKYSIKNNIGKGLLYGYITFLAGILLGMLLLISIVGIFAVPILIIFYYIIFILGFSALAINVGEFVRSSFNRGVISVNKDILIGVLTIEILRSVVVFHIGSLVWNLFIVPLCIGIAVLSKFFKNRVIY